MRTDAPNPPRPATCWRRAVRGAAIASVLLLAAGAALAGSASSPFQVSVALQHYVKLSVLSQPSAVQVSAADIARGYVDVETPVLIAVESDSRHGFAILLTRVGDFVRGAHMRGLGRDVQLTSVAELAWRPQAARETVQLQFRLQLVPDLAPGRYAWPIQVDLSAL